MEDFVKRIATGIRGMANEEREKKILEFFEVLDSVNLSR